MQESLLQSAIAYRKKQRKRKVWSRVVSVLGCIVVFCTTYALILPAITMENFYCGKEEHTHTAACYVQLTDTTQLTCDPIHTHDDNCKDEAGGIVCGKIEAVAHAHDELCYAGDDLICTLEEIAAHTHGETCYTLPEAHAHGVSCYASVEKNLICTEVETEAHSHGETCWTAGELTCTTPESEGHTHDSECTVVTDTIVCQQEETVGHSHDESCYSTEQTVICGLEESEEHAHVETCYASESKLICQQEESAGHSHDDTCHNITTTDTCGLEEFAGHSHGDDCYAADILNCTLEETAGHAHSDACYETIYGELTCTVEEGFVGEAALTCAEQELQLHIHDETCFTVNDVADPDTLTCTLAEDDTHTHGELCYGAWEQTCAEAEHTHALQCYSDPGADVETAAVWEQTFANVEFTGNVSQDVVAIAKTQLSYLESTRNYYVLEDGTTMKGYTRYGAWYGVPYGDWCAMFVSFCLHYGGAEDFPLDAGCTTWIEKLTAQDRYRTAGGYHPKLGDVIFFDYGSDGYSDHVGLVAEVDKTNHQITVIEGNCNDTVQYVTYAMDDTVILGYGWLLEPLDEEAQARVDAVIELIDAMPSADEIDAKLAEFEEAEDYEGEEAYYTEVVAQVGAVYQAYSELSDEEKQYVTNADKLLELEYIWSQVTLIEDINSAAPTPTWYTSTKDFVELNLYDYNGYVNANYWSTNNLYPGFQWNGGAYSNDSGDGDNNDYRYYSSKEGIGIPYAITDRNYIDSIDFGNSLITNFTYGGGKYGSYTKAVNSTSVVKTSNYYSTTGPINWIYGNSSEGYTNKPIGMSTTDQTQSQNVMSRTLQNGYPALSDGTSLKYLFTNGTAAEKQNTESIDGLFQQDSVTGEYSYNSRTNHAQYSNNFFTLYDQIITPNFITYPFGNFLPLNTISDSSKATQVGAFNYSGGMYDYVERIIDDLENDTEGLGSYWNATQAQLVTMLEEYKENWSDYPRTFGSTSNDWTNLSPANAIRDYFWGDTSNKGDQPSADTSFITQDFLNNLYNIDWDVQTNFFFGMEMKMNFMQPKDGYTGNDTDGDGDSDYPMVFYFTGDDDVWVYIDDVLFLDLSGIHRHVGGEIDFVNGWVYYYELDVENGGDVSKTPYAQYSFAAILRAAGWTEAQIDEVLKPIDSAGNRPFKDYSTHSFNFYYIERGSGSSVCRINFNFPLLKKNSITVSKQNASDVAVVGNPDVYFNIVTPDNELFVGPNSKTGVSTYTILDAGGNEIGTGTVDEYGIFKLKAGQTAVFEGIEENEGEFFVQELIKEEDNAQYGTVTVNGVESRYNSLIDWSHRTYFSDNDSDNYTGPYGYKWYGRSGYDTDSSANSTFYFEAINGVTTDKLVDLSITKKLVTYVEPLAETSYRMYVALDGIPLPVGTVYTLSDGTTGTVTEAGYIEIVAGQTATIENLISGTQFEIKETEKSSAGYAVDYEATGADEVDDTNTSITGVVRAGTNVAVTVTNSENGASIQIPVTKALTKYDEKSRSYKFALEEVADQSGSAIEGTTPEIIEITVGAKANNNHFGISYFGPQLEAEGVTFPKDYFYKITEVDEQTGDVIVDDTVYIVKVTVSKADDAYGTLSAAITGMWKNGEAVGTYSADFVNTLAGDLTLSKEVVGGSSDQGKDFSFTIKLEPGDSGLASLPDTYTVVLNNQDGTTETTTVTMRDDGSIGLTMKHNESLTIQGIPYGAKWTITEAKIDGFIVTTNLDNTTDDFGGTVTTGNITVGNTVVAYTNTTLYSLPETGGMGTHLYTMAGLMLMLCSTAFLMYRLKKRRREDG